jgi:hypothetical protein
MKSTFEREPVAFMNALTGLIEAGIALAVAFGIGLNSTQTGAIMAFVVAIGVFARVLVVRGQVTPLADPRDNDGTSLVPSAPASTIGANSAVVPLAALKGQSDPAPVSNNDLVPPVVPSAQPTLQH